MMSNDEYTDRVEQLKAEHEDEEGTGESTEATTTENVNEACLSMPSTTKPAIRHHLSMFVNDIVLLT